MGVEPACIGDGQVRFRGKPMGILATFFESGIVADLDAVMPYRAVGISVNLTRTNKDGCNLALRMANVNDKGTPILEGSEPLPELLRLLCFPNIKQQSLCYTKGRWLESCNPWRETVCVPNDIANALRNSWKGRGFPCCSYDLPNGKGHQFF